MAMRQRGGAAAGTPRRGGRAGTVRRVYEDFKPSSEWQQEDESHILSINLPGFMKEQLKVSTEGRNTIKVCGERLVAGNKWSRFEEDFQVPENGEMNSVRAKFQGGILNISIPKKDVKPQVAHPASQPNSTDVQKQATPQKGPDKVLPEASTSQPKDKKILEPQKTSGDQKQSTIQNVRDSQAIENRQSTKEKSLEQKALEDQKQPTRQKVTDRRERSTTPLSTLVSPNDEKNDRESKRKHITAEVKKVPGIQIAKMTKREKDGAIGSPEKKEDYNELGVFTKENYKKAVKGLTELNEERQLLVNMGVAMLVIVSLTAYVTYKFASGKDKN